MGAGKFLPEGAGRLEGSIKLLSCAANGTVRRANGPSMTGYFGGRYTAFRPGMSRSPGKLRSGRGRGTRCMQIFILYFQIGTDMEESCNKDGVQGKFGK